MGGSKEAGTGIVGHRSVIRRFLGGKKTSKRALTNQSKPDIMKFRGVLCDDEQPKGGIR